MDQLTLNYIERSISIFDKYQKCLSGYPDLCTYRSETMAAAGLTDIVPGGKDILPDDVAQLIFDFEDDSVAIMLRPATDPQFPCWKIIKPAHISQKKAAILASFDFTSVECSDVFDLVNDLVNGKISSDDFEKETLNMRD